MIRFPDSMQLALEAGATTHCRCWRIERRDGAVFGFTDHDRPLSFDGLEHAPHSGASAGEASSFLGGDPAEASLFGVLDDDRLRAADLDSGLWDGAEVSLFRVDWRAPEHAVQIARGEIVAVSRQGAGFEADVAGLSNRLSRRIGRSLGRACDAALGDVRCGHDITAPPFRIDALVAAVAPDALYVDAPEAPAEPGWFEGGALEHAGTARTILSDAIEDAGRRLVLSGAGEPPGTGAAVVLVAGCDKTLQTCLEKFNNHMNFQGFPHMPGDDLLQRRAPAEPVRDGESRNP